MNAREGHYLKLFLVACAALLFGLGAGAALLTSVQAEGQNGTTLTAGVSVSASITRTWDWDIQKSVDRPTLDMFTGDSGTVIYTVKVTRYDPVDAATASGEVCVTNGGAELTENLSITVDLATPGGGPGGTPIVTGIPVDVSSVPAIGPANSACYAYSAVVSGLVVEGQDVKATAHIRITNHSGSLGTPKGPDPSGTTVVGLVKVNETIDVTDTFAGSLGSFAGTGTATYSRTFGCDADAGKKDNTATIAQTNESSSASVQVNCYKLGVSKTVDTTRTRTWTWTLIKTSETTSLTLAPGQQLPVTYKVTISATSAWSLKIISGEITVHNPAPVAATLDSVSDVLDDGNAPVVDCGVNFPYTLAAGTSLTCDYSINVDSMDDRVNTATATLQNSPSGTTNFTGSANVDFSEGETLEVDDCITVSDDKAGPLGNVCREDLPENLSKEFTYSLTVGPYDTCGDYTYVNVASFVTTDDANDTDANGTENHTVNVNVPCAGGCTLTQGYWKTHSVHGPAPEDADWTKLGDADGDGTEEGADETFFNSGKTYYEVLWTAPAGNPYYNLAHQYIAAKLNVLNGASTTTAVDSALTEAKTILEQAPTTSWTRAQKSNMTSLSSTLDGYNNGLIGPGHCSE